jgi:hypothetical protein
MFIMRSYMAACREPSAFTAMTLEKQLTTAGTAKKESVSVCAFPMFYDRSKNRCLFLPITE